jgi:hypothetical protein
MLVRLPLFFLRLREVGTDTNFDGKGYFATMQIGTPPRDFRILMDSGSAGFAFFSLPDAFTRTDTRGRRRRLLGTFGYLYRLRSSSTARKLSFIVIRGVSGIFPSPSSSSLSLRTFGKGERIGDVRNGKRSRLDC